ncbi:MAG: class I SAM-dependent methyltransferase [Chloroflexaceae bacterium]|nr:class I SAM-dependent methyltransferase [Chloroflexaceae bacterium]
MFTNQCPVCQADEPVPVVHLDRIPVLCNVLCSTREAALNIPRGDVKLAFCPNCGHVWNTAFEPALMEYTPAYENSLHFSPTFQSYARSLAERLIGQHHLHHKDLVEIGCGQGDFLRMLCALGNNRGVGFDPGYLPPPNGAQPDERVRIVPDSYSARYASYPADLICCRQVLEHIQAPGDMLQSVRRAAGHRLDTVIFFEVPNALFTLRDLSIYDIIYEHSSYFSAGSLAYVFAAQGFHVREVREEFNGQFLSITAQVAHDGESPPRSRWNGLEQMAADVQSFTAHYRQKTGEWNERLETWVRAGRKVVVWGGGSKGTMFLNTLRTQGCIEYVVDINPRKQGRYVAGAGQQIVPPDFLRTYHPDVVIVMNPVYQDEIRQTIEHLGVPARFEFLGA